MGSLDLRLVDELDLSHFARPIIGEVEFGMENIDQLDLKKMEKLFAEQILFFQELILRKLILKLLKNSLRHY